MIHPADLGIEVALGAANLIKLMGELDAGGIP